MVCSCLQSITGFVRHSKRRAAGEGNIRQRADGAWEARLTLPDGRRKSFYGATQREVRDKLTRARSDRDRGLPIIGDERETVGAYLHNWLKRKTNLAPSTRVRYAELFRHVTLAYGDLRLTRLMPAYLASLYARLQAPAPDGEGLSSSTVRRVHAELRDAVKLGMLQTNATERVDAPRNARYVVEPFTLAQARQFLEAARGNRLEALYVVALSTGARLGELLGLTWSAVSLDGPRAGTVEIRASLRLKGPVVTPAAIPTSSTSISLVATPTATPIPPRACYGLDVK